MFISRNTATFPTIPRNLDSRTSIRINGEAFEIEADDLESQCVLGRGAYGVVEKVKHKSTGTVLAVKVRFFATQSVLFLSADSYIAPRSK